jgi:hypothetical protein
MLASDISGVYNEIRPDYLKNFPVGGDNMTLFSQTRRWIFRLTLTILVIITLGTMLHPARAKRIPRDQYQVTPSPVPTATPDLRIATLQTQVSAQSTQVANQEKQFDNQLNELRIKLKKKYQPLTTIAAVAALLGIPGTALGIYKYMYDKTKKLIDKKIYAVDPVNAIVHVPQNEFDEELEHLKWRGFYKFRFYQYLDNTCLEDCVVVKVEGRKDIEDFRAFLEKYSPDPEKVAYVIYTKERVPPDIVETFPNVTYANSIVTLGTNLFTIARSLIR